MTAFILYGEFQFKALLATSLPARKIGRWEDIMNAAIIEYEILDPTNHVENAGFTTPIGAKKQVYRTKTQLKIDQATKIIDV